MKLSIVIPIYNSDKYIDQCIGSIINQNISEKEYEILLIDDGSKDNSNVISKRYSNENSNIHLYSQKNQGVSIARNNGIIYAKGKYIYFVDADDYIALDTLIHLIKFANFNGLDILEFSSIRTKLRNYENSNTKNNSTRGLKILEGKKYIASRGFHDAIWAYFYKREFLLNTKIKFYEGRTKQDMIFNAELIPKAKRVAYYPLDVYRYVITPDSITTNTEFQAVKRSIEDFIYITIKYNELILKLEYEKVNTFILRKKQQTQLFNISKLLLISDFKFSEINEVFKILSNYKLYPLHKSNNFYRKILITFFNKKILFYILFWAYRIFRTPIEIFLIKNYQNKKEKQIISSFN